MSLSRAEPPAAQVATDSRVGTCAHCRFFVDEAAAFEQLFPGILALSSGQGDTRGTQGVCELHAQLLDARMSCPRFSSRG